MITETRTCACGSVMRPAGLTDLVICGNCDVPQPQEFERKGPGRIITVLDRRFNFEWARRMRNYYPV